MSGAGYFRCTAAAVIAITTVVAGALPSASACGLEPTVNGGFTVSHPGALDVAVAVADARRAGLLPQASPTAASDAEQLRMMLADLQRLQSRLSAGRVAVSEGSAAPFSLVLVGPGLWSHFHMTSAGVEAHYHVDGPLDGGVVVLTHYVVLEALLQGTLTTAEAAQRGLIDFEGGGADSVREVFETGIGPKA